MKAAAGSRPTWWDGWQREEEKRKRVPLWRIVYARDIPKLNVLLVNSPVQYLLFDE